MKQPWLVVLALTVSASLACAQESASWHDPSKHDVQIVTVEDGVRLEVLDWGGSGRPVVLLAGYNTAHVFDGFAEKLAETCHVYGITRRGFGASSRPDAGYTSQRSADDVLQVIDSLRLVAPVLVGHSFGGQDIETIGARHSERIGGLVYLNSAEDPTLGERIWAGSGIDPAEIAAAHARLPAALRNPPPPDDSSFQARRDWQTRTAGVTFPESELRQLFVANPDGSVGRYTVPSRVRDAIHEGTQKPDYAHIRVPVLALFASPSFEDRLQRHPPRSAEERAAIEQVYAGDIAIVKKHIDDLRSGVLDAHVIELPGANHYLFLSNEADVLRELGAFVAGLNNGR